MKKIKYLTIAASIFITFNVSAAAQLPTVYECDSKELHDYIKVNTAAVRSPSTLPLADEVHASIIEAKIRDAEEGEHCLALWGDVEIDIISWEEMKAIMDDYWSIMSSASTYSAIIEMAKRQGKELFDDLQEQLMAGICSALSPEEIMSHVNRGLDSRYGYNLKDLDGTPQSIIDDQIRNQVEDQFGRSNSRYLYDPDRINNDVKNETKNRIRRENRDFWGGI